MRIKLKEGANKLESWGSHQGFPKSVWNQLNEGKSVVWSEIPDDAKDQVEEVAAASSSKSTTTKKTSSSKGGK